jgi:hypothetical protein
MPSLRRRHSDPQAAGRAPLRSSLADAAFAVEDRVVLGAGGLMHSVAEAVRWPFERIAWAAENFFVWPIQEETALWSRGTKAAVTAALVVLAGGAVAAGVALAGSTGSEAGDVATLSGPTHPTAAGAARHGATAPSGPVLHGTAPNFAPEAGAGVPKSKAAPGGEEVLSSEPGARTAGEEGAYGKAEAGGAAKSGGGAAPEVAGPAAIKVAREFASAFVLYEIGDDSAKVKRAIAQSSSSDLTQALLGRPPRQPSNVKVPKAKVLNIVPGPAQGGTYTLSVSLLRVGVTSELRLDMKQGKNGTWQVTDALG